MSPVSATPQRAVGMRGAAAILGIHPDTLADLLAVAPGHRLYGAAQFLLSRCFSPNPSDTRRHRRWNPSDVEAAKEKMR